MIDETAEDADDVVFGGIVVEICRLDFSSRVMCRLGMDLVWLVKHFGFFHLIELTVYDWGAQCYVGSRDIMQYLYKHQLLHSPGFPWFIKVDPLRGVLG
jgi:hypothetical protein